MNHPPAEQLSDLLDGDLPPDERALLEAHLAGCAECAALHEELRRVVQRAGALEDRPPAYDLWPGVAAAIGAATPGRRRLALTLPQLMAAGIALMLLSGGGVALALRGRGAPAQAPLATTTATPEIAAGSTTRAERGYDAAVRELGAELEAGRSRLDSTTVRVVEQKLRLIDRAIAEAEQALAADPANTYLNGHLARTRLRKLDLLRRAALLTRAVS